MLEHPLPRAALPAPPRAAPPESPRAAPRFREKRFVDRESLLTELLRGETARAAYNIAVVAFLWLAMYP